MTVNIKRYGITDKIIHTVCTSPPEEVFDFMEDFLVNEHGYSLVDSCIEEGTFYYAAFAPNDIYAYEDEVCLVAHLDTIGTYDADLRIVQSVLEEEEGCLMHNGGGYFDDRAGVLGIIALVNDDCHPYIILTGEEEVGCVGAIKLVHDYPTIDLLFGDENLIQCLIELDRQGVLEVVFYDLVYPEFEKIFTRVFDKKQGSFTDIAVLGPSWEIAAANISVGYYCEHSPQEFFLIEDFCLNINKIYDIICEFHGYNKEDRWEYKGLNTRCVFLTNKPKYSDVIRYTPGTKTTTVYEEEEDLPNEAHSVYPDV